MDVGHEQTTAWRQRARRFLPAIVLTAIVAGGLVVAQTTDRPGNYIGSAWRVESGHEYGWPASGLTQVVTEFGGYMPNGPMPARIDDTWHTGGVAVNATASAMLLAATFIASIWLARRSTGRLQFRLRDVMSATAIVAVLLTYRQREYEIYDLVGADYPHLLHGTRSLPWYASLPIYLGIFCTLVVMWRGCRWCGKTIVAWTTTVRRRAS